jgi:hypothetical protein
MADRIDIDSSDNSCEMTDANQQLERELLQCQQRSSLAAVHSRRIVSLGISPCCDMRLVQIRNQAEPSELIPMYLYEESS